jgi:hypothetical protein
MRQKFSFKKGVLKFAAIASVLAFAAGQFGGYASTAFAEESSSVNVENTTTSAASVVSETKSEGVENPSNTTGTVANEVNKQASVWYGDGKVVFYGTGGDLTTDIWEAAEVDSASVTKVVIHDVASVDEDIINSFTNIVSIANTGSSTVTLPYDTSRYTYWMNKQTGKQVTSVEPGDTVYKGYYAKFFIDGAMKEAFYIYPGETVHEPTQDAAGITTWYDADGNVYDFSKTVTGQVWLYNTPDGAKENSTTAATSPSVTVTTGSSDDDDDDTDTSTASTSVTVNGANSTNVANKVKDVAAGSTVTVDMSSNKTIAKNVLEAAKGKNVDVVLDMGSYKWTINGSSIGSDPHDVNMNVSFGGNNIPQDTIAALAGNNSYRTISLDYSGPFGFTGFLSFNVGSANAGKYVNLYYYNADKQLEYQNSGVVDKNGNTSLSFSHASEYVAIISDTKASATSAVKTTSATSPITADAAMTVPFILLMFAAAAVMFGARAYKKRHI